jgi:hypothetical protein
VVLKGGHSLFFVCGDFMSASRLGNVHKGAHMIHLFNEMGVDYGAYLPSASLVSSTHIVASHVRE